jgi:hypothetical protein
VIPVGLLLVTLALLAGCDDGGKESAGREAPRRQAERLPEHTRREALVIRKWLFALNAEDYALAGSYFARGAIIDQGAPTRLRDAAAARRFNAALPCQADLVGIEDEPGPKTLASFRLRAGPGGPCSGIARVRFTIRKGRFTEWRQLPGRPDASGRNRARRAGGAKVRGGPTMRVGAGCDTLLACIEGFTES